GTTLLAGTLGSGVYRSTVSGGFWSPANNGMTDTNINALAVIGSTVFAGTDNGVYRSRDTCSTWTKVNSGLPNGPVYSFAVHGTTLFTIAETSVFISTNEGDSWSPMNSGLTDTTIYKLALTGTTLFAAANTAIYRYDISGVNAVAELLPFSSTLTLSVQPNPARDAMLVHYNVGTKAELDLFNILGERVMNARADDSGESTFDVNELPAGMYLLTLRSNNETKTQTVMIVR
ncbi:MAG TPA: T9SS type A sorting domain-containing protein, partial [Candidatus Kapabacteria bacterium]|nr:T9SS type A sorting domain-containing protein [Candidatus Kapabacteria bacterium]